MAACIATPISWLRLERWACGDLEAHERRIIRRTSVHAVNARPARGEEIARAASHDHQEESRATTG
jgi:hypothetical protein